MISVCMATYDGERFIKEQIESILSQLSENDELIISDDGSTDDTLNIIKNFKDKRITLLENNTFHSPIYNFENALKHASGDYIFLSDQDDVWLPNKVSVCMEYLKTCDLLIHDAEIINGDGDVISSSFFKINHTRKGRFYNLLKNGYHGCCMVFNSTVLKRCLPFPQKIPMHDSWIGNIATFNSLRVKFVPEILIKYRRHESNASISGERSKRPILQKLKERLLILNLVLKKS